MCITFFNLQSQHYDKHGVEFVIGFNRDEKSQRDTLFLGPFEEDANIYAGKDKKSGGTWLGVNIQTGIMVVLTNYDLPAERIGKSRGKLVLSFLKTSTYQDLKLEQYNFKIQSMLDAVLSERQLYSAFNLVIYSIQTKKIFYICSEMIQNTPRILENNFFYGMCNGPLDELWQKTKHGLSKFEAMIGALSNKEPQPQKIKDFIFQQTLSFLKDNFKFDENLEKQASVFIKPYYSQLEEAQRMTKCSFVCLIRRKGGKFQIVMKEVTYTSPDLKESFMEYQFKIGQQQKLKDYKNE